MTTMSPYRCTMILVLNKATREPLREIPVDAETGALAEPLTLASGEEAWAVMTGVDDPSKSQRLPYEWWVEGVPANG